MEETDQKTGEITETKEITEKTYPFSDFLSAQRDGGLLIELDDALRNLVGAVEITGKAGYINCKISVKPGGKDTIGAVLVSDVITLKAPEQHPENFFFVDNNKNLSRNKRPGQLPYPGPLLEVGEKRPPLKEV